MADSMISVQSNTLAIVSVLSALLVILLIKGDGLDGTEEFTKEHWDSIMQARHKCNNYSKNYYMSSG